MAFEHERVEVMKFGGTSMDDMDQVEAIERQESADAHTVFVVSAFSGVTDKLFKIADGLIPFQKLGSEKMNVTAFEPLIQDTLQRIRSAVSQKDGADLSHVENFLRNYVAHALKVLKFYVDQLLVASEGERELLKNIVRDRIISIGEVFSAHALSVVLTARSEIGKVYQDIDTTDVVPRPANGLQIHPVRGADKLKLYQDISTGLGGKALGVLKKGQSPIVPGYVGWVPGAIQETIERGYTDWTAAIVARGLDDQLSQDGMAVDLTIWKEVPGLLSADPRLVEPGYSGKTHITHNDFKVALLRRIITFREAAELSAGAGMKAINPNGIFVLDKSRVRLFVRNTFDIQDKGTRVIPNGEGHKNTQLDKEMKGIRFVSGKKNQTMFTVESDRMVAQEGVAADILGECRRLGVGVDAITTSATSLSFSVNSNDPNIDKLQLRLRGLGSVERQDKLALVCCIGNKLRGEVGLLAKLSAILGHNGINIEFDGGDKDSNLTFVVDQKDYEKAVKVLHGELFEGKN